MYNNFNSNITLYFILIITLIVKNVVLYLIPSVEIEVFSPHGIEISIPDEAGVKLFAFHGNINRSIDSEEGSVYGDVRSPKNGSFTITLPEVKLNEGDVLYYWIFIQHDNSAYQVLGKKFTVKEIKSKIEPNCEKSVSKIYNTPISSDFCRGELILNDDFNQSHLNLTNWQIEKRIPTYVGPDYEFNSYIKSNDTLYIANSTLSLRPIYLQNEEDVRGTLNLLKDCTGETKLPYECFYQQKSVFLLPPVKSARISSKISFKFGKIHVRCKLPSGDWIYPVVQIEAINSFDNLPKIWIAFSRGNHKLIGDNDNDLGSTLLFGGPIFETGEPERSKFLRTIKSDEPFSNSMHTYQLEWYPDRIVLAIDNTTYGIVKSDEIFPDNNIFSENDLLQFRLSLGVAVGGLSNFPDGFKSGKFEKPWNNNDRDMLLQFFNSRNIWTKTWKADESILKIDYVKIWAI